MPSLQTSNPAFRGRVFENARSYADESRMTVAGAAHKTLILLALCCLGAFYTWRIFRNLGPEGPQATMPWMMGGLLGGLVFAMITIFKPSWAMVTAPIYAVLEGLFLGAISAMLTITAYPGIVLQAVGLTMCVFFLMLTLYSLRIIQPTRRFVMGIVAATGAIFLLYLVSWILAIFGTTIPYIHSNGPIGIGFSLVVVGIAALNLILDFGMIEAGARSGAPKYMEWYGAFALMVTLIWLYIEILRLLSKLNSRR